jgi:hypothetical protein
MTVKEVINLLSKVPPQYKAVVCYTLDDIDRHPINIDLNELDFSMNTETQELEISADLNEEISYEIGELIQSGKLDPCATIKVANKSEIEATIEYMPRKAETFDRMSALGIRLIVNRHFKS